jgi:hypothetical protein
LTISMNYRAPHSRKAEEDATAWVRISRDDSTLSYGVNVCGIGHS